MKIGAQLFTVRDYCQTPEALANTLKRIADIGYRYVQVSGVCEYDPQWLKDELDKNGLQCVLTHIPAVWLRKLRGRVPCIHAKDITSDKKMAVVGEGTIDWDAVLDAAKDAGVLYVLVGQDECYGADPFAGLERSYAFLSKKIRNVRLGIIGIGNQGAHHVREMEFCPELELTAVADTNPERLAWAEKTLPEVARFDDGIAMLDSGLVDACLIAVPHYDHPALAIECLKRGIHVMVEKPAGVYTKQVREMNATRAAPIAWKSRWTKGGLWWKTVC